MLGGAITITIDGEAATLRPSLRAAVQLERQHGFSVVVQGILEGNTTILADVVQAGIVSGSCSIMRQIEQNGVVRLDVLKTPLLDFIAMLIGVDDQDQDDKRGKRKNATVSQTETFAAYFERLFSVGTGWLGWSPEQTWEATPAEIVAAQNGRVDMLKAIFGNGDSKADARKNLTFGQQVTATMASLGARVVKRPEAS